VNILSPQEENITDTMRINKDKTTDFFKIITFPI
jgi:hypothetical protein